jgi:hypothetical protein
MALMILVLCCSVPTENLNLSFVVDAKAVDTMVRTFHQFLFRDEKRDSVPKLKGSIGKGAEEQTDSQLKAVAPGSNASAVPFALSGSGSSELISELFGPTWEHIFAETSEGIGTLKRKAGSGFVRTQ